MLPPFPQTPILDDFNRANEDPLDGGGNWPTGIGNTIFQCTLNSNSVSSQSNADTVASRRWTAGLETPYGSSQEVYCTIKTSVAAGGIAVFGRVAFAPTAAVEGYRLYANFTNDTLDFHYFAGVVFVLLHSEAFTWAVNDKLGFRSVGSEHYIYVDQGSGWNEVVVVDNAQEFGDVYDLGIGVATQTPRADDFGGGNLRFGQIIRH